VKIAFLCDTHFGVRNDSPFFLENAIEFFEQQFFPYLEENKITEVVHLGDFFDRRKYVNFNTLSQVRKRVLAVFEERKINLHITIGNHDTYYRNSNNLNSLQELIGTNYSTIQIYEKPTSLKFGDFCFGIIPWVVKENEQEVVDYLRSCPCRMIGGHFEIVGFQVIPGVKHHGGFNVSEFKRFDRVLSGHFHIRQSEGNIHYLGTQYQLNFSDVNVKKGFHIYDTEMDEMLYVENANNMFYAFVYDDSTKEDLKNMGEFVSETKLKNCFIRLIVRKKTKQKIFDKFIDALWEKGIQSLAVIEEQLEKSEGVDFEETEDTMSIISREIDGIERDIDKVKLKTIIRDLYMESLKI
jgi:UDP-2,3-diacylglucosamine pyrophosphatase LpxH